AEYLDAVDRQPAQIEPYIEAAQFFADRKDAVYLDRVLSCVGELNSFDLRLHFYRAVVLILRRIDLPKAEALLNAYVANIPQRSDYPSHNEAAEWLRTLHQTSPIDLQRRCASSQKGEHRWTMRQSLAGPEPRRW